MVEHESVDGPIAILLADHRKTLLDRTDLYLDLVAQPSVLDDLGVCQVRRRGGVIRLEGEESGGERGVERGGGGEVEKS
jgi:hypothetical protein|tara:strand:+ start:687 stop:923 length:237 start_codon:yes stop_codon:yes gene_type:complete